MIRIKVFYLDKPVVDDQEMEQKESFLVQKKSLLKGGFRAFILDDPQGYIKSDWYKRYADKEQVEFYIKNSGVYRLANLDLTEGEMYFEKSETPVYSQKRIFVNMPFDDHFKTGLLEKLKERFEIRIEAGTNDDFAKGSGAVKLDSEIFKAIRISLLFVADITPLSTKNTISNNDKWLANSNVMLELGYALAVKPDSSIVITYDKSKVEKLQLPFDIQSVKSVAYNSNKITGDGFNNLIGEIESMLKKKGM